MIVKLGMFLEPDAEHRNHFWACTHHWPLEVEEIINDRVFTLKGASGSWSTIGLIEAPVCLENK